MTAPDPLPTAFRRLDRLVRLETGVLFLGAALLTVALWPSWLHNPDLAHGLFLPAVFLILLGESRSAGPHRYLAEGRLTTALLGLATVVAVLLLALAGLYAAVLDWDHALVQFLLAGALAAYLFAGLVVWAGDRCRFVPFNWASLVAIGLWVLAAPIPPGNYARLTIELQMRITQAVLVSLHLLGIPAVRSGNILQLARATVGVEEACSGVRSLISCVFAALFFSATLVSRPGGRLVLILLAAPLALAMNFLRSLTLTLMANAEIPINGFWHDVTGYSVLILTGAVLGAIAVALERKTEPADEDADEVQTTPRRSRAGEFVLAVGLALALALVVFAYCNTRSTPTPVGPEPDLAALLPAQFPGWSVTTESNLDRYAGILRTHSLALRSYTRHGPTPAEITFYLAYWHPGQAPVSLVAAHTPDACWPGAGWTAVPEDDTRVGLPLAGGRLPPAERRVFRNGPRTENVWFWHLYAGRPIAYRDPYSIGALARIALKYGFLHNGSQLFIRVSSNRPWPEIAKEPLVRQLFEVERLVPKALEPQSTRQTKN